MAEFGLLDPARVQLTNPPYDLALKFELRATAGVKGRVNRGNIPHCIGAPTNQGGQIRLHIVEVHWTSGRTPLFVVGRSPCSRGKPIGRLHACHGQVSIANGGAAPEHTTKLEHAYAALAAPHGGRSAGEQPAE